MKGYLLLILGMMLVTYIPRLLPLITLSKKPLSPFFKRVLTYIPYTALSALIVKGIMQAPDGRYEIVFIGISVAALISWIKGSMVLSVLTSIIATFLLMLYW